MELREAGHELAVEIDAHEELLHASIDRFGPELILAPFLRRAIPTLRLRGCAASSSIPARGRWRPDALGHAILDRAAEWGVTVLEATSALDAGPVHAFRLFPMREATKSDLYANEVTDGAVAAVFEALEGLAAGRAPHPAPPLRWRGAVPASARAIDFERDDVATILRKAASGDGAPGATATLAGRHLHVFDLHREERLAGRPVKSWRLARMRSASARATGRSGWATRDGRAGMERSGRSSRRRRLCWPRRCGTCRASPCPIRP